MSSASGLLLRTMEAVSVSKAIDGAERSAIGHLANY